MNFLLASIVRRRLKRYFCPSVLKHILPNALLQTRMNWHKWFVEDADYPSCGNNQEYKCPILHENIQDRRSRELFFPTTEDIKLNTTLLRSCEIQTTYSRVEDYQKTFVAALTEQINIILWRASEKYRSCMLSADLTMYLSKREKSDVTPADNLPQVSPESEKPKSVTAPSCNHSIPGKLLTVKRGENEGRQFYACSLPRSRQCKFFKWQEETEGFSPSAWTHVSTRIKLNNYRMVTSYLKRNGIDCYCQCIFIRKIPDAFVPGTKVKIPKWIREAKGMENVKKRIFIQLPRKEHFSVYKKDDIWVISHSLDFEKDDTFIARSTFYGPSSKAELEIQPLSGYSQSKWNHGGNAYALLICNASTELTCIRNLQENLTKLHFPLLPHILDLKRSNGPVGQSLINVYRKSHLPDVKPLTLKNLIEFGYSEALELGNKFIEKYGLNEDQSSVICSLVDLLCSNGKTEPPIMLIHGVFGSGKSFLLSVMIILISEIVKLSSGKNKMKILLSSTTNVAVDRVLLCLLDLGFTSFCRVGSVRKIATRVLPYSLHVTDSEHVTELQKMLANPDLSQEQKQYIRKSLEQVRLGATKSLLSNSLLVGVTCAASTFACLRSFSFPLVVLDECTQCTEPLSLLPIVNFGCRSLILVGDPNQLPPTIEGAKTTHDKGLEQTLFTRLCDMGHIPTMLCTQYRCHPTIGRVVGKLFYHDKVKSGITEEERPRLVKKLPNLMFYDISDGQEERGGGGSYKNEREASFVTQLVKLLLSHGIPGADIGIIALYKAQIQEISNDLHTIELQDLSDVSCVQVSTVDAFQGAEKNVIVLSCVRSTYSSFADCDKRMCVALTRARNHLLIVGHRRCLSSSPKWSQVITSCADSIQTPFQFRQSWGKKLEQASSQEGCLAQPPPIQQYNHLKKFREPLNMCIEVGPVEVTKPESPLLDLDDDLLSDHVFDHVSDVEGNSNDDVIPIETTQEAKTNI